MEDAKQRMVFYISFDGMTDPLGQSQVLPYLSELSKKGFKFHIFSLEKPDRFASNGERIAQLMKEEGIQWSHLPYSNKIPVLTSLKLMRKLYQLIASFVQGEQPSLIHFRGYQPGKVALKLKKKYNIPVVFDMRSFLPEERKQAKIWDTSKPMYRAIYNRFKKLEDQFYRQFDVVVSQTQKGKEVIRSWGYDEQTTKVKVIPCCADLSFFDYRAHQNTDKSSLKKELGIEGKVVMGYLGSLGTWYCLDEMMAFFAEFKKKHDAVFLILTPEPEDFILSTAKAQGVEQSDIVVRFVKRPDLPKHIALFDVSVFFIQPGLGKAASSPVKQGELLGMGVHSVVNKGIGDVDLISNEANPNLVVDSFSQKCYQDVINNLKLEDLSMEDARSTAEKFYDLKEGVAKYEQTYREVLNG